jgi:hypothetical protein
MNSIGSIFCDSMRPLKLVTVPLYALCAVGLSMAENHGRADLILVLHVAPLWIWALMCAYISVSRYIGLFIWQGTWWTRRFAPILGITIWAMLFSASLVAPNFGMGLLYIVAAFIEVWILARAFAEKLFGV